ncbi:hypothetical protein Ae263Ps1_3350c [Pseudonocardia sp. Ae263_Ps1]|nr:hypothetical protein Ae150APs1_1971 [Pseudonocardia sp. Ae150A_Ps1]OLL86295.1 hypothetical protein Ae263Ps1_3350c [Pseudonocardia sp. Ae263_Ps1]OLL93662.1 hypothetical protein Ae356Ps1_3559 [Pseudonocardia sp. Ae356_Ps1]
MSNELLIGPLAPARRGVAGDRAYVGVAVATDVIGWCAALVVAVLLRYELALAEIDLSGLLWMSVVAAGVQVLVGVCRRSYTAGRAAAGDGGRLILSVFAVGLVVFVLTVLQAPPRATLDTVDRDPDRGVATGGGEGGAARADRPSRSHRSAPDAPSRRGGIRGRRRLPRAVDAARLELGNPPRRHARWGRDAASDRRPRHRSLG